MGVVDAWQPEAPPLLLPPLLLPARVVLPPLLLFPEPVLPPLLLPSVRPPSGAAAQKPLTQSPVQQSTSDVQELPRPALGLSGTQLWQFDEMVQPVGQAMSPQLPPVPPDPLPLHDATTKADTIENRTGATERCMVDLRAS